MQMPTVGPEQKRLNELFSGTWRGEEKMYPSEWDPAGNTGVATWTVRPGVDGFALVVDYETGRDGQVMYRGHGVHSWDPTERCFFGYWFDNMGAPPKEPVKGKLDGDRYWYLSDKGAQRMSYTFSGETFEFRLEMSKDGGKTWAPMQEGKYKRAR